MSYNSINNSSYMNSVIGQKQHREQQKLNLQLIKNTEEIENLKKMVVPRNHINSKVLLGSNTSLGVYADSLPIPQQDEDNRDGWLFNKISAGTDKFNYYFYGEGNTPMTLQDLTSLNAIITVDNYQSNTSLPFFVVYTKMKMDGTDTGSFYHSKKAYTFSPNQIIDVGEKINIWSLKEHTYYNNHRSLKFNEPVITGNPLETDEILTISIQSDSGAPQNTKILIREVGYDLLNGNHTIKKRVKFN